VGAVDVGVYRYTVEFEADDDEQAKAQVFGDPQGRWRGANDSFETIHDEKLQDAESGRKVG
jgi:hypothetical protein